ncbi:hypothetical protein [Acidocella aromatica]|uniref:Uncharacterized protein n=1 Tax=Acidocella aromatica TaxID=1303579 RepID=A0A840VUZ0_9PROT|nr:hypothetical protein [Acidocella aromatica]MBB5373992.1 hypothetical protein [Acidocella aromatica]
MKDVEDTLAKFLEMVRSNQLANRSNHADWYAIIKTIDDCFVRGGANLVNPQPVMGGILFLRCQYAFKTAAGMALAGQVTEVFVMLRSVLEYAGYALLIHDNAALQDVWLGRHVSPTDKRAQKDAFRISDVKSAVKRHDARLGEIFDESYERTVDFGGHPNPHAAFSAMHMDEDEGQTGLTALAISNDVTVVQHALKSTAQIGLTALHIFQHVFTAKFELLGIREVMEGLMATGRL